MTLKKELLSESKMSCFDDCKRKYYYRYVRKLYPKTKNIPLFFGAVAHCCYESKYNGYPEMCQAIIDSSFPTRNTDAKMRQLWNVLTAFMSEYNRRYCNEPFHPAVMAALKDPAVEHSITIPLRKNTSTEFNGHEHPIFKIFAKLDAIMRVPRECLIGKDVAKPGLYLMEHKTTSAITDEYWMKVWTDSQIVTYQAAIYDAYGVKINGVIYNVVEKPSIKQGQGETEEEFQERYKAFCAKNKKGTSDAKRKTPESDSHYLDRLEKYYAQEHTMQRRIITIDEALEQERRREWWGIAEAIHYQTLVGVWPRSRRRCNDYHSICEYFPICNPSADTEKLEAELYTCGLKKDEANQ